MLVFATYLKKETMKEVKQFFSSQIKSICLLFTIVAGGFLTLSSCSPPCDEGNYLGTVEECSVTADTTASGGGSGGSSGGSSSSSSSLTPQSRISAGGKNSAYILDNGSVVQWGIGSGSPDNNAKKTVDNITNARQVSVYGRSLSGTHTCVITSDDRSVCWGDNEYGQLGDGTSTDCGIGSNPAYQKTACAVPVFDDATAQGNLKKVVTAEYSTLWLDNNGKVYSAGRCDSGRLGVSCSDNHTTAKTVMTGVKDIGAAKNMACALKTDDTLHCWGANDGNGITDAHSNDVATPLQIATNVEHFDIGPTVFGTSWVAMVHDNNTVFCTNSWYNSSYPCANQFAPYTNVKSVYVTDQITGLLLDNGTHVSYGKPRFGAMADKARSLNFKTPAYGWIQENGSQTIADNIAHITLNGEGHLLGIMDNGSVVGVGSNSDGQLGGTASNLTCYSNGTPSTPCPTSGNEWSDVWIYLNLGPTQLGP